MTSSLSKRSSTSTLTILLMRTPLNWSTNNDVTVHIHDAKLDAIDVSIQSLQIQPGVPMIYLTYQHVAVVENVST